MDDTRILEKIGELIGTKLQPIKQQLDTVEMKVELINKKIEQVQEETIEAISELIISGHDIHEQRIKKIEDHIQLPQTQ